jgi:hypothetical protein
MNSLLLLLLLLLLLVVVVVVVMNTKSSVQGLHRRACTKAGIGKK